MKINCEECGETVVEGKIEDHKNNPKAFVIDYKPKGTIFKHNSNNPEDWTGFCSECQKGVIK